jgi:hypothetical protein
VESGSTPSLPTTTTTTTTTTTEHFENITEQSQNSLILSKRQICHSQF